MDKLVLQAVEEVALEGPEGEQRSEFVCSTNLRLQLPARLPQAVLHVSFGSCWIVACRQKSVSSRTL